MSDNSKNLQLQIKTCIEEKKSVNIQGGNSKHFYGNKNNAEILFTSEHNGIINYQPSELVITARAGTPLSDIIAILKKNNQQLPFEPPKYADNATLGGTIACGFSGSARPFFGAARDAVLGCKIINGQGEILHFGGEVFKNVAGYDVSRLVTGAMGTLGLLLEISIKVQPITPHQVTLVQEIEANDVSHKMTELRRGTLPLSAIAYFDKQLYIRLNSTENAIKSVVKKMDSETLDNDDVFWHDLNEHQLSFFQAKNNLWKINLPPATNEALFFENSLIDWAGGLVWHFSDQPCDEIHAHVKKFGGHALLFRRNAENSDALSTFPPLNEDLMVFHQRIKQAFDPNNVFNPRRMYSEI